VSTGLKIALIGCGLLLIICVVALGVGGYFAKKWLGEGVETVKNITGSEDSHYGKKIAELNQQYPFTPSPDSLITDKQLQRFLNVRKSLFMVYKNHEANLKN
jgi:hypothetical protein